jgi:hypothetical protein
VAGVLTGPLQVLALALVLGADPGVDDLVGEPGARPVGGDNLPVVFPQVEVRVLVVTVPLADELARVDQPPTTTSGAAVEPVGDDRLLVEPAEVLGLEVEDEPGSRVDHQGPHAAALSFRGGSAQVEWRGWPETSWIVVQRLWQMTQSPTGCPGQVTAAGSSTGTTSGSSPGGLGRPGGRRPAAAPAPPRPIPARRCSGKSRPTSLAIETSQRRNV